MVLEVEGSLGVGSQLIVNTCAMTPEERHDEGGLNGDRRPSPDGDETEEMDPSEETDPYGTMR